jgi:hypothetical protein
MPTREMKQRNKAVSIVVLVMIVTVIIYRFVWGIGAWRLQDEGIFCRHLGIHSQTTLCRDLWGNKIANPSDWQVFKSAFGF